MTEDDLFQLLLGPSVGEGRGGLTGERTAADCPTDSNHWSYYDPGKGDFIPDAEDIRESDVTSNTRKYLLYIIVGQEQYQIGCE